LPPGKISQICGESSSMAMNGGRENSLLARQTEAIRQMLTLNQVSSVCYKYKFAIHYYYVPKLYNSSKKI
jgi:hypothetical protein